MRVSKEFSLVGAGYMEGRNERIEEGDGGEDGEQIIMSFQAAVIMLAF